MHAQSDPVAHAAAIREGRPFETYGNLSGAPRPSGIAPDTGWMRGAAREALEEHSGRVAYVLWSYRTPNRLADR